MSKNTEEELEYKIGKAYFMFCYIKSYIRYILTGAIVGAGAGYFANSIVKYTLIGAAIGFLVKFIRVRIISAIVRWLTKIGNR